VLDDVAACRFGDDILLVTVDLATPMFGRDELELLGTVVSTSVLALERLTALEELQTREAQLVQSHRIAAVGSWEWHPVSREFNVTEELLPIFGLPASVDNVSLPALLDTIPTRDRDALERVARRAIQVQGEFAIDHELRLPDGSTRVVHTRGQVDTDSTFPRLIGTVQDVTDRKAIENALREAYDREREATERLTSLDRMKDGILVAVSHELRTPLTSILGFVMTLRDRGDSLDQATRDEMVEHMVDQAEKLDRLLTDLLNLNRLRSGTVDSNPSHVNVAELVRSCVEELGIPDEQLTLELEEGDNVVDTIKVERIIENLLTNARKYGPREGQITVQLRRQAGVVELIVSDEGPGIAPAERARVFDPFHRAPGTENIPGTGIGLSLVAEYAELHSGSAWVAANASGGAEFHVQLHDLEPRS
jgi:signal transduction histidine kinase